MGHGQRVQELSATAVAEVGGPGDVVRGVTNLP